MTNKYMFYEFDAFFAVYSAAKEMKLNFPIVADEVAGDSLCNIEGCFNPFVTDAIKNDVYIEAKKNIWFLTGANMTGKSTILKSIGIAIYLAQMGFPVPADKMVTIPFSGLLTTINLSDDIGKGHSHFFSEIFRIKFMAETLQRNDRLFIIIDELFKGTNYEDAYQATLGVLEKMVNHSNSIFLISSHITDVVSDLDTSRIELKYLVTNVTDDKRIDFTYRLENGVAKQRLGMWLLERERIFELLDN